MAVYKMTSSDEKKSERISKRMSRAGLCSRREAERWVLAGRVKVNGTKLQDPAVNVTDEDYILVDGKPIADKPETRLWRYNKPTGLVTTHKDEKGRKTVFEALPEDLPRVISIGRLDLNTEGLLLLTNNGELARFLEHPSTGWSRRYKVRAFGKTDEATLRSLKKGIEYKGITYGSIDAKLESVTGDNVWLNLSLTEGKNREVRNVLEAIGLKVNRLIRLSYGPFQLGNLKTGHVEEVNRKALKSSIDKRYL